MWTPETRCPMEAALALRDALGVKVFVETGTAQGDTAFIAAGHFGFVYTIEIHPEAFQVASRHLARVKNVEIRLGDSAVLLEKVLKEITSPALFWLDGHYSGGPTTIGKSECPLLDEIRMIRKAHPLHCMIVDDMQIIAAKGVDREREFAKGGGWSKRPQDWPHVDELIKAANEAGPFFSMIDPHKHTALFLVPENMAQVVTGNI